MISVLLSRRAERDIKSAPANDRRRIFKAIECLESTYFPDRYDIRKMKGFKESYRIRIGSWRILYRVDYQEKRIYVGGILKRSQAYK
jgi:mRNA interferase RelE/StbE